MNDFTISIYCFVHDSLKVAGGKAGVKRKLSDAEVIITADSVPGEYFIAAGTVRHVKAFEAMNVDLPVGSKLYAKRLSSYRTWI